MIELLVINPDNASVVFSSGTGRLTRNSKIAATVVQVLTLFSKKVVQSPLLFLRFENSRMIFISSMAHIAVSIVPKDINPRQVVPVMRIVLRILEQNMQKGSIEKVYHPLDALYRAMTAPEHSLIVLPRNGDGILSMVTTLATFAHDLKLGITDVIDKMVIVDTPEEIHSYLEKKPSQVILSFMHLGEEAKKFNIPICEITQLNADIFGLPQNIPAYGILPELFRQIGHKYAYETYKIVANADVIEAASTLAEISKATGIDLIKQATVESVLRTGQDILLTLSTPVINYFRNLEGKKTEIAETPKTTEVTPEVGELSNITTPTTTPPKTETLPPTSAPKPEKMETSMEIPSLSELEELTHQETIEPSIPSTKPATSTTTSTTSPIKTTAETTQPPSATTAEMTDSTSVPQTIKPISVTTAEVKPEEEATLEASRKKGTMYQMNTFPVIIDFSPNVVDIDIPPNYHLNEAEEATILRILSPKNGRVHFYIQTATTKLDEIKDYLETFLEKVNGQVEATHNTVLEGSIPVTTFSQAVNGLIYGTILSYLLEVLYGIKKRSDTLMIPNEGALMLIPPNKKFERKMFPRKIKEVILEEDFLKSHKADELWEIPKVIDELFKKILTPLKKGNGAAFQPRSDSNEVELLTLIFMQISFITGISYSRW